MMHVVGWLYLLPSLLCSSFHVSRVKKPSEEVPVSRSLSLVLALANLPLLLLFVCYLLAIAVVVILVGLPYAALRRVPVRDNIRLLRDNCEVSSLGWRWSDVVKGLMAMIYRQDLAEFLKLTPTYLSVVPLVKYVWVANPFLFKLDSQFTNQWTEAIGLDVDTTAKLLRENVGVAIHEADSNERIDSHIFSAYYPLPKPDEALEYRMGVKYCGAVCLFTHARHWPRGMKPQPTNFDGSKTGIFQVELGFLNPFDMHTGYVEVNVVKTDEGAVLLEHPMWCVLGPNSLGRWAYKQVDELFFTYAPQIRSYLRIESRDENASFGPPSKSESRPQPRPKPSRSESSRGELEVS
ncbi:MAG: hypothetical protein GY811_06630 [Myxococcales bacterium]|nr:hypothetical protein [Myxococcales bacterium]